MLREPLRNEIRSRLEAAFRDRLQRVLLFGTEARGEAGEDSDVDLLVLADFWRRARQALDIAMLVRRIRASRAVARMRRRSAENGLDRLSPEEIEAEIQAVRRSI